LRFEISEGAFEADLELVGTLEKLAKVCGLTTDFSDGTELNLETESSERARALAALARPEHELPVLRLASSL